MWKGNALIGNWVNHVTLAFGLTSDFDLRFFKVKFRNSCFSGIVTLINWKQKEVNQLDTGLTTWPCFDYTPDLDLEVSRVKVWNSLISGMGGPIDMIQKGCESYIHDHDTDLYMTMVGWADVLDSDQGDFRHRHAIDISSLASCHQVQYGTHRPQWVSIFWILLVIFQLSVGKAHFAVVTVESELYTWAVSGETSHSGITWNSYCDKKIWSYDLPL